MKNGTDFGVVWIRRGEEVAVKGSRQQLGDLGTLARIVDFDQLPNGLLGVTIEGRERFHLSDTRVASNGLVLGNVVFESMPEQAEFDDAWLSLREILENLKQHPHVRRMGLEIDFDDAWQVGYTLAQLLPLEESLKYSLLNAGDVEELMDQLDLILSDISGEG